jgi:TP901 family phage tail tape measure protein
MAFDLTAALRLNDAGFTRGMRNARRSMGGLRSSASEVVTQLGLITGAAGAVGAAFLSAKKAMDFESQMSTIKALTGATGAEMKQMTDLAMEMGAKTKYSALEAAKGIEELLKAGISPAAVQSGALQSALNLATAGGLELAEAAEVMSTALNAFKDDALTAEQASNILAGTANASATGVHELRYSLSMVSAVAAGLGMSFRDTNSALGVLANNGLKGSDAGTSLKTMLSNLEPKTKRAREAMHEFGITTKKGTNLFFDAQGKVKSMAEVAGVLHDKLKKLNPQQRQTALYAMFGSDAIRAGTILYKEGAKGISAFNKEMSKVTALDVAKEKMNNASGAVEVLKGALETFQIQVMTPLLPVIKDAANQFANWMSSIKPEQIQAMGDNIRDAGQKVLDFANFVRDNWVPIRETVIALAAGLVTLRAAMMALMIIQTINTLMIAYRAGTLAATLAQWGLNAAMLANPIGLVIVAIAALVAAGVVLYRNWDVVSAKMSAVWSGIKRAAADAVNFMIGEINKLIGLINKIPGVNIPIIPKVEWGRVQGNGSNGGGPKPITGTKNILGPAKKPKQTFNDARVSNVMKGYSHAGGLNRVPYDSYPALLHKNERVLTSNEAKGYNGKGGHITIEGGIHLHGVAGNLEKAADKILDIIANKVEAAGGAGA